MVINKHNHDGKVPPGAINIMRGTTFCNPFIVGRDGDRHEVVELYRRWLWREIQQRPEFANAVKALHGKDLCCCCAPLACHGYILARAAKWLNQSPSTE